MSRTAVVSIAALLAIAMVFASCGDDSCPTCPVPEDPVQQVRPPLYVIGEAALVASTASGHPLLVAIDVYNTLGTAHHVDSAYVDSTRLCVSDAPDVVAEDGHARIAYWNVEDCFSGVIPEFTTGSTTEFSLYCQGTAHTARLHLLDHLSSVPANLQAVADSAADELQLTWNPVADAEWYSVKIRWKSGINGWHGWDYHCADSAAIAVPLALPYQYIIYVDLYVAAGTGPRPDNARRVNNVSGGPWAYGTIYSVTSDRHLHLPVFPAPGRPEPGDRPEYVPSLRELMRPGGWAGG